MGRFIDLTGQKFGKLTVVKRVKNDKYGRCKWLCICECGNSVIRPSADLKDNLKNNYTSSCGCSRLKDLTGHVFGKLTVIERSKNIINSKSKNAYWLCKCSCDDNKYTTVVGGSLTSGNTKSCGCLLRESTQKRFKKYNEFNMSGDYGICYTSDRKEVYFDKDDYSKIKDHYWTTTSSGYVASYSNTIFMHKIVMNCGKEFEVDHINFNKLDNRKSNLRICTMETNQQNKPVLCTNTSGVSGVYFDTSRNKWCAFIGYSNKNYKLGFFINKEDAIKTRLLAEKKYYGEFSPQQHLYEQYGIYS